jgi:hypothetical protein
MGKITTAFLVLVIALMVAVMTVWGMLAIYYSDIPDATQRTLFAGLFGLATLSAFIVLADLICGTVWTCNPFCIYCSAKPPAHADLLYCSICRAGWLVVSH